MDEQLNGQITDEQLIKDKDAISTHYDLPVEFFANFLGPRMAYSCAYFTGEHGDIAKAEEDKLELLARKLMIKPSDYVLDIGCGWGSFLFYAAEKYNCKTAGITLAEEQVKAIKDKAVKQGLDDSVNARIMHSYDLRFDGRTFDKIVTVGAIEHMEDLDTVFKEANRVLKDDGLFLVHGMTQPWHSRRESIEGKKSEASELINEHFGIGYLKGLWEVIESLEKAGFEVLDHENITQHYKLTVEAWLENLQRNEESIAGKIIPEEKYREFLAFMAAYIVGFDMSGTFCNQILCKKIFRDEIRMPLPLTRRHMIVGQW